MDFSEINNDLLVGTTPSTSDYDLLRGLEVGLVINMRMERRPYPDLHTPPIELLWLPTIDSRFFPIPIRFLLHGVRKALPIIQSGKRVYTHCAAGRHRGVAMGAAILIAKGFSPESAIQLIEVQREIADPRAAYIQKRIMLFSKLWKASNIP